MFAPQSEFYPEHETEVWILFDFRCQGIANRLRRECSGWCGFANLEKLDAEHAVLVIRPGGALMARR